jgi:hypothetical protein
MPAQQGLLCQVAAAQQAAWGVAVGREAALQGAVQQEALLLTANMRELQRDPRTDRASRSR